jgi:glycosyltransferase involved in cell wall biosynthesis
MRILLFDWYTGGHHEGYLAAFTRALVDQHTVIAAAPPAGATAAMEAGAEPLLLESSFPPIDTKRRFSQERRAALRAEVDLLRRATGTAQPDHTVHLFADTALRALVRQPVGAPLSVLLFRPRGHIPASSTADSRREAMLGLAYDLILQAWRRRPDAHAVLTLDPLAARAWSRRRGAPIYAIPEPAPAVPFPEPRRRHGIVLFGALSGRKGLHYLADALEHDGHGVKLVLAGAAAPSFASSLESVEARLRAAGVDVELRVWYHDEVEFLEVLAGARAAVLPYVGHIGMSRVLVEAASVGTPVIAHAEGLLGYLVKTRGLGITVDCRNAAALAAAVREVSDPDATGRYTDALRSFAAEHSVEHFAAAVREPFNAT